MISARAVARALAAAAPFLVTGACASDRVDGPTTDCVTPGLAITGVVEDRLIPGASVTVTGCQFGALPVDNSVTIDGLAATVQSASTGELRVLVPLNVFPCAAERTVILTVTAGNATVSRNLPLVVAAQHALAIGGSVTRLDASDVRCNELSVRGARYFISVFNTSTSPTGQTSVQLRGAPGRVLPAVGAEVGAAPIVVEPMLATARPRTPMPQLETEGRFARAHADVTEESRRIAVDLKGSLDLRAKAPAAFAGRSSVSASIGAPSLGVGSVGDVSSVRVWKRGSGSCAEYNEINARTVYIGTRSIVREDVDAPLAGTMDDYYRALGQEFDETMFPILEQNFGNPLALDHTLDNNGRLVMVFTKRVNDEGLAGFVISCDFFPRTAAESSNEGEYFYAFVPVDPTPGYLINGMLSRDEWRREIRGVLIHEAKHVTSFSEHLSRNAAFEQTWLEEGTAMHAEELWSRLSYGSTWKGNTTYRTSVYCDLRQGTEPAECASRPLVMFSTFAWLYDYLADNETLSPLGRQASDDFTFYGSAWAFVRWVIDHYATSDAAFLKPLTQESALTGLENVAARVGKTFPELLGEWSLAMATDDIGGFTPSRAQLTFPSWQTRDIFRSLSLDYGTSFPRAFPLAPHQVQFGNFSVDVPSLRGGTAAIFELTGTQAAAQLLELRTAANGPPPANIRIAIVRVQ